MTSITDTEPLLPNETSNLIDSCSSEASESVQPAPSSPTCEEDAAPEGRCTRVASALNAVTIEPILFLYITGWAVQASITTNMLLEKVLDCLTGECQSLWIYFFIYILVATICYHLFVSYPVLIMVSEILSGVPSTFFCFYIMFFSKGAQKHIG